MGIADQWRRDAPYIPVFERGDEGSTVYIDIDDCECVKSFD
jgi:hypothetical protein